MKTNIHLSSGEKITLHDSPKEILGNISEQGIEEGYSKIRNFNDETGANEEYVIFHSHITHIQILKR